MHSTIIHFDQMLKNLKTNGDDQNG